MKNYEKIMKNIEQLGERYCRRYLDPWNKERLQTNWWEALKFLLSHSFMRRRRDRLSNEYYYFTIETLKDYFSITDGDLNTSYEKLKEKKKYFDKKCILKFKKNKNIGRKNSIKDPDFRKEVVEKNPIVKLLITPKEVKVKWDNKTYSKVMCLGNDEDVMMVLDVLKFISDDDKKNIYNYLRDTIVNFGVKAVYEELIKIRAVSDKISTLIIRDIVLMSSEIKITYEDAKWAFPVDTWVIKIAHKLGCNSEDVEKIKNNLVEKCRELGVDPLKFAAGLWFLGYHSLDILLENCIGEIKIEGTTSVNSG